MEYGEKQKKKLLWGKLFAFWWSFPYASVCTVWMINSECLWPWEETRNQEDIPAFHNLTWTPRVLNIFLVES